MCDAGVLTENWRPTVVKLVPFSLNRNKEVSENCYTVRSEDIKRHYPILAVTRCNSGRSSLTDFSTMTADDKDGYPVSYSGRRPTDYIKTDRWIKSTYHENKVRSDRESGELRFSIQNLNEQALPVKQESPQGVTSPRSSASQDEQTLNSEVKSYSDQNGFKRNSKLTPGELELQKQRDAYVKEQSQRRKKYKLNVNQLPRSTTPINDHDPDKLNMKQVINFLQKKTSKVPQTQNRMRQNAVRLELHARNDISRERPSTDSRALERQRTTAVSQDRPATEIPREIQKETSDNRQRHRRRVHNCAPFREERESRCHMSFRFVNKKCSNN